MIGPATSLGELIGLLFKEGKRRLLTVTALFSASAILALGVGVSLPKKWDAAAVLRVEDTNIIKPLMEGRAITTAVDQTVVVTQVVMSRKIMREMLVFGGWLRPPPAPQPDPREEQRMLDQLRAAIKIESQREGLIRISYHDKDQQRSYKIANKLAEIYVREATEGQERESREAFDFIDRQVKEYGEKLTEAHEKVLAYYRGQETPPAPAVAPPQPGDPRPKVSPDELAALRAEEVTLAAQLGKAAVPKNSADLKQNEERARNHVIDLQGQLDRMLVSYTDEHPDVRRLKRELAAAQEELSRAEGAAKERRQAADAASALDDQVAAAARLRLENVRQRIATITGKPVRRRPIGSQMAAEFKVDPEMHGVGHDTRLSELLRQYESTRDIYQDLLKRRENARVSMELDAERRGLSLRIQEAAELPVIPSSLRLMHVVTIGMVLALLVPLGFLLAIVALDRRVRSSEQIIRQAKVPLLVSVGYSPARRESSRDRKRIILVALMVTSVVVVYAGAFIYKLKTS